MKPLAVESTTLTMIAYDLDCQLLQLEFRDRAIYHYFDVPVDVYQGWGQRPIEGRLLQSLYPKPVRTYSGRNHAFLILALMGGSPDPRPTPSSACFSFLGMAPLPARMERYETSSGQLWQVTDLPHWDAKHRSAGWSRSATCFRDRSQFPTAYRAVTRGSG